MSGRVVDLMCGLSIAVVYAGITAAILVAHDPSDAGWDVTCPDGSTRHVRHATSSNGMLHVTLDDGRAAWMSGDCLAVQRAGDDQ